MSYNLCDKGICPFETCFHTLWRLIGELDRALKEVYGEFRMFLCSHPYPKVLIYILS